MPAAGPSQKQRWWTDGQTDHTGILRKRLRLRVVASAVTTVALSPLSPSLPAGVSVCAFDGGSNNVTFGGLERGGEGSLSLSHRTRKSNIEFGSVPSVDPPNGGDEEEEHMHLLREERRKKVTERWPCTVLPLVATE